MDATAVASAANWTESLDSLGWPTMSVVNLFGTAPGVDSQDMSDSSVMGSEGELDSMQNGIISRTPLLILTGNALGDST